MKRFTFLGILFLTVMAIMISCEKSAEQKIIGTWEISEGEEVTDFTFKSDGTIETSGKIAKWELSDGEPMVLIISDGDNVEENPISFISDDEIELTDGDDKIILKRKK